LPPPSAAPPSLRTEGRRFRRARAFIGLRKLFLLRALSRWAPSEAQRLFALTAGIGVLCGVAALGFHLSIQACEGQLINRAMAAAGHSWIAWTIAVPTLGGMLCGVLLERFAPNARGSGIPQVKLAFASQDGRVRARDAAGKFLIGTLQIGSGASLGREGPTVQICAGIASLLGRIVGVSPKAQRRLLPVGVAAGIAAAFNAPIAAVTFTIEEVVGSLDKSVLSGVIVAAAIAAVIERSVLGEGPVFEVLHQYGLKHLSSLLIYAMIGVAAGGVSLVFTELLLSLRSRFRALTRVPAWLRPAIGGLVTGVMAVIALLAFRAPGITGGGYQTLTAALAGEFTYDVLLALAALKLIATVFSYASGGAGGIFAPTLFIGATLGGALGTLDALLLGHHEDPSGAFALVGMGAVFAGTIRAPITSVLIIIEMTRGYSLILPLMIANMTAYVIARRFRPVPIYEALLAQDGVELPQKKAQNPLENELIGNMLSLQPFQSFRPELSAAGVLHSARESTGQRVFPVVDAHARLLGIVTQDELAILQAEPDSWAIATASDLMRPPVSVGPQDDLAAALETMLRSGIRAIPVTNPDGTMLGFIDEATIARAYVRGRDVRPRTPQ
jgi:chloride channel protein, CIC family